MPLVLDGTNGVSGVDGTASNPAIEGTDSNTGIFYPAADTVAIGTGGTERLRVDSSGNAGLGVTPSAWASGSAIQMAGGQGYSRYGITNNSYYDGANYRYVATGAATLYGNNAGSHLWFNAPSGTAGNAITFTQAMTLDSSGNLLVGNTSSLYSFGGRVEVNINGSSQALLGFGTGGTGRGYIYSDGTNFFAMNSQNGYYSFGTNNTERARITSGGDFLVGKAAADDSSPGVWLYNNSAQAGRINIAKNTSGLFNAIANYHSGTYVGGVNYSNTATSFPTSSDVRLKKNIVDAGSASAKIEQIRIVSHGWKHDDEIVEFGVVAQELVNVAPQAVSAGDDREEIETTWGVDYSKLVPMLIKAHQEQQVMIYEMKAEIAALKGTA